jgi:hypothetical protein
LRERNRKRTGAGILQLTPKDIANAPGMPNPDGRTWHALTVEQWARAWASPMASRWLETDRDALGRLAVLWDDFNRKPDVRLMAEIRQQEARFGFSPLDRSRLSWEIAKADEAERKGVPVPVKKTGTHDPRSMLR